VQIVIKHRNVVLTEQLRQMASEKITRVTKYLPGMDHAEVTFFEERNPRIAKSEWCEVTLHGHGHHVRAKASAIDSQSAVDLVVDKLAIQLSKLKDKVVTKSHDRHHHYGRRDEAHNRGGVALLEPDLETFVAPEGEAPNTAQLVKTKQFVVSPLSVEDAALKMDLLQHDFYLFTSAETGRSSVIYRRDDGNLGLIEAAAA
jgi:putative sigma-54 modulation protein